ncbi:MAG: 4Fe-4S dicluster domain-containing protein [Desulfovibrionaceae bacterium]|nr:4Fe-4S dicluster domain-containing protein [Desulfovibrionaceae bacterium]
MSAYSYLTAQEIPTLVERLAPHFEQVLVPTEQKGVKESVIFAPWTKGSPISLAKATVPPKAAVFPKCETLFSYKIEKDTQDAPKLTLNPEIYAPKTLIFAARPCDALGLNILDRPFLQSHYVDPYYAAKRDKLCVVTLTCPSGCENCFCHWVGIGPAATQGADIVLTAIKSGYVAQAMTQKGQELLEKCAFKDGTDKVPEVNQARKAAWESLKPAPDLSQIHSTLAQSFADLDFWTQETQACLSCGACTYFCPTCYCFTITDEGDAQSPQGGQRLRSQDNCMAQLYTREASGHNPRPNKALRMRNRVTHKYMTYKETWGAFACSGCGRCIQHCPVGLDIRAILLAAIARTTNTPDMQGGK